VSAPAPLLETPRLGLVPWTLADAPDFHRLWGDPRVIFWGASPDLDASRATLERLLARGVGRPAPVGWHALRLRADGSLVGSVALQPAPWDPAELEVGWHLCHAAWGRGYATEAAEALIQAAFARLHVPRVVCAILPSNARSLAVAARLGFTRYARDVLHGGLPHDVHERRPASP
jgi:RimJ/RimL family protein N-acetyltransferase